MRTHPIEQYEQQEFERKAKAISQHILGSRNHFTDKPIEELEPEELQTLVKEGFDKCALNYILSGNFDRYIESEQVNLTLHTTQVVRHIEEVQEVLQHELNRYIENLKRDCERYKAKIYEHIRAHQDEQRRRNESNPFSN